MERSVEDGALFEALYGSALQGGDWRPALDLCSQFLACAEVSIASFSDGALQTFEGTQRLLGPEARQRYEQYYGAIDPKLPLIAKRRPGFVFNDSDHFDETFVRRDPFYQEFSRWVGTRHTLDISLTGEGTDPLYFAAMRTERQGPFAPRTEAAFGRIAGHFGRVQALRSRLALAERRLAQAAAALDWLAFGLVVLGEDGRELIANAAAREILSLGADIEWRHGRPAARASAADRVLQASIDQARQGLASRPATLRLPRADGGFWVVWVMGLAPSSPLATRGRPGVLVMISDPAAGGAARLEDLKAVFGLTEAEAELALALGCGATLESAAGERGIRRSTARSQLLSILEKMGVHRQADVARLVAGLSIARPSLPGGPPIH